MLVLGLPHFCFLQHSTCKHIREVIGHAAEDARLASNALAKGPGTAAAPLTDPSSSTAGAVAADGLSNPSIPRKVSLAQTWSDKVDPTGWLMSEKYVGMQCKGNTW